MIGLPSNLESGGSRGFSLVEMLTTIAILGVLTGIALPTLTNLNKNTTETRDRRNAQELASVCAIAQAAGINFVVDGDIGKTIKSIVTGATVSGGAFDGKFFGVPGLSEQDQKAVQNYLQLGDGTLSYAPSGASSWKPGAP